MEYSIPLRARVLLVLQNALLGEVSPPLRGVTCRWTESEVFIRSVFDGPISEEDRESMEFATTSVMAALSSHEVHLECLRRDTPQPFNDLTLAEWVYRRREDLSDERA